MSRWGRLITGLCWGLGGLASLMIAASPARGVGINDLDQDGWPNDYEAWVGTSPDSSSSKPATPLLQNSGFETAESWNGKLDLAVNNYLAISRSDVTPWQGQRSIKVSLNGVAGSSGQNFYQPQQLVPVNSQHRYVAIYWMKTVHRAGGNTYSGAEVQMLLANGQKACDNGTWCHCRSVGGTSQANTPWTLYRAPIVFTEWPQTAKIRFILRQYQDSGASGEIWYDNVQISLDMDGDLMPDEWEVANGLNPMANDAAEDFDGDGLNNTDEFKKFTRADLADTDDDGLNDGQEISANTNPLLADTDADGMPDGWEIEHGLNPLVNDAAGDADGDYLSNLKEYQHSTDPQARDTDNDGLNDNLESGGYGNPTNPDTDEDGLADGYEYNHLLDVFNSDMDGDGLLDGAEVSAGTDPLVAEYDGTLYHVLPLGTLGGQGSYALRLNELGQVTGSGETVDGHSHAFLYTDGQMVDLGTLGGEESEGVDLNEAGQVAGSAQGLDGMWHPVRYSVVEGAVQRDTLGLDLSRDGYAAGLNDHGTVVGTFDNRAFMVRNNQFIDLDLFIQGPSGGYPYWKDYYNPCDVNNLDNVLISQETYMDPCCKLVHIGMADAEVLDFSMARAVFRLNALNERNDYLYGLGGKFVASQGKSVGLGTLIDNRYQNTQGTVRGLNNMGVVVGMTVIADGSLHGGVFPKTSRIIVDLNDRLDHASKAHWEIVDAADINDKGEICGTAKYDGGTGQAVLLVPVADTDKDYISDETELELGLDSHLADTDQDGMPDGWELLKGLNPLLADAEADVDGDTRSNLQEYLRHTDPHHFDLLYGVVSQDVVPFGYLDDFDRQGVVTLSWGCEGCDEGWGCYTYDHGLLNDIPCENEPSDTTDNGPDQPVNSSRTTVSYNEPTWQSVVVAIAKDGVRKTHAFKVGSYLTGRISLSESDRVVASFISMTGFKTLILDMQVAVNPLDVVQGESLEGAEIWFGRCNEVDMLALMSLDGSEPENLITLTVLAPVNRDLDQDGLSDYEEAQGRTALDRSDTDNDGMPDKFEVDNGLNPLVNDAAEDADSDGLSNLAEYQHGTQVNGGDSDGDGASDGEEILSGTSPLSRDYWYVNAAAAGLEDGSLAHPFSKIQEAVAAVEALPGRMAKHVILVAPGRYTESVAVLGSRIEIRGTGSMASDVMIDAANAPLTLVDYTGSTPLYEPVGMLIGPSTNVTVRNLQVAYAKVNGSEAGSGVRICGGTGHRLEQLSVSNCYAGLRIDRYKTLVRSYESRDCLVENCEVLWNAKGILINQGSFRCEVKGCNILKNSSDGIWLVNQVKDIRIVGNQIGLPGWGNFAGVSVNATTAGGIEIVGNTLMGNMYGVRVAAGSSVASVAHNNLAANVTYGNVLANLWISGTLSDDCLPAERRLRARGNWYGLNPSTAAQAGLRGVADADWQPASPTAIDIDAP